MLKTRKTMVSWQAFPSLPPSSCAPSHFSRASNSLSHLSRLNSWFKSWFIIGFSGKNSEPTVKQRKNVFSRKHRAHCLKAMPGYWCKIAKHCKQILLPEILKVFTRTWKESNVTRTFQSISSWSDRKREGTKMDRVTSRLASAVVDVVEFRRVWDRIKPIIRNKTKNCSEQSPKIGLLTDWHTRWQ